MRERTSHFGTVMPPIDELKGVEYLTRTLHLFLLPNLEKSCVGRRVDLRATLVSDEGLDSLSRMSQLKTLHIGDTGITDLGVKKISQFKKLEGLTLTNLSISDQALTFLTDLPRLRYLDLEGTNVTPAAGARLQKALPDCKIRLPNVNSKQ